MLIIKIIGLTGGGHNRENIPKGFLNLVVDYGGLNDI